MLSEEDDGLLKSGIRVWGWGRDCRRRCRSQFWEVPLWTN